MNKAEMRDGGKGLPRAMMWKSVFAAAGTLAGVALVLFIPAGTVNFWQAWAYLGLFFVYFAVGTPYFLKKSPELLRRRLRVGPWAEEDASQKIIMTFAFPSILLVFLVPGLDRRFGWSAVPAGVSAAALICCLAGMAIAFYATAYNQFVASTITVEQDQPLISTGPYAVVRHPLYSGVGLWFFVTPIALGSWWGMLPALLVPIVFAIRLTYEERTLRERLPGYAEYCRKVRWRLIPGVF